MRSKPVENSGLNPATIPVHVAVIMDGNGRWAQKRLLNRVKGHERGSETVRMIVRTCRELGIQFLTLYAFSTENWQRPKTEVRALMTLLKRFLVTESREMIENDIRLNVIGQIERLPQDVQDQIRLNMEATRRNTGMCLNLALSYGGRAEILNAVQAIAGAAVKGELDPDSITPDVIARYLYTAEIPDPELLIRTSGEYRISNFLLWQIAYSEIFVTPTLWPDFTRDEFIGILKSYQSRERRFGRID